MSTKENCKRHKRIKDYDIGWGHYICSGCLRESIDREDTITTSNTTQSPNKYKICENCHKNKIYQDKYSTCYSCFMNTKTKYRNEYMFI